MTLRTLVPMCTLAQYREPRAHIFPSAHSLTWYVRQHKPALVERGALLMHAGQWRVVDEAFDRFVVDQGQAEARRSVAAASPHKRAP